MNEDKKIPTNAPRRAGSPSPGNPTDDRIEELRGLVPSLPSTKVRKDLVRVHRANLIEIGWKEDQHKTRVTSCQRRKANRRLHSQKGNIRASTPGPHCLC